MLIFALATACTMKNNNRKVIEKEFQIDINETYSEIYYAHHKPEEFLSIEYNIAKINSDDELWQSLRNQFKKVKGDHGNIPVIWDIDGFTKDWWNPSEKTPEDAVYISLENGWIQGKFEDNYVYLYKTTNN